MAVDRKRVTKRHEPHPADAQAVSGEAQEDEVSGIEAIRSPAVPALESTPVRERRHAASKRTASPATPDASEIVEGPKVPTSFRLPRSLLTRLDKGSRVIPAQLDKNVSKNQIVEMAIDSYLRQYDV